ncbi:hypothetical protein B8W66_20500 [Mycobacterium decipiens]|uniref:Uncharacterized protein n=1 Tax=Mycobacterium decipiens TaxID=1430326 RepID=A0A1X2LQ51_9MYCO|nr:hypothetical protein B8W66_20500 [Mycobacterium decipiens]
MASDMLCCQGGTSRHDYGRTGPGPGAAATVDVPVWVRAGNQALTRGALRDRYPDLRARHLRAAVRPVGVQSVRRTRCGGSAGGNQ